MRGVVHRRCLAGENPAVAGACGPDPVRERHGAEDLAARHRREEPLTLLGRPEAGDGVNRAQVSHDDGGKSGRAPRQLLDDHRGRSQVEPEASISGIDEGPENAELGEPGHQPGRMGVGDVEVLSGRNDKLVDELSDREDHLPHVLALRLAGGQGSEPLTVSLEQALRDDGPLDLVRALADDHQRRVAVVAFDVQGGERAGAAVEAQRLDGDLLGRLGREELRHPRFEIAPLAAVLHRGRPRGEESSGAKLRRHVGDGGWGVGAGASEMGDRVVVGSLRDADGPRGDVDPSGLEPSHHVLEATALDPAHQICRRHRALLEDQLGGVDALVAELRDRFDHAKARVALLDDEAGHPTVARVGPGIRERQERQRVALAAVGDEELRAADEVLVPAARRDRTDRLHVRPGVRLGQREAAARLAAREAGQEARALRLGPVVEHDQRGHRVAVDDARQRHPAAAELLDDPRVRPDVQAEAAVCRRHQRAEQTELAHAGD